ncbi:2119_t:CDS:1, partial [Paraglomus occultum]
RERHRKNTIGKLSSFIRRWPSQNHDSGTTTSNLHKREIRPPPPKDYPETSSVRKGSVSKKRDAEMKFLRAIIREFKKKQHAPYAYPFYEPVDRHKAVEEFNDTHNDRLKEVVKGQP